MEPNQQDLASFVAQLGGSEIAMSGVGGKRQSIDNQSALSPTGLSSFAQGGADNFQGTKPHAHFGDAASEPSSAPMTPAESKKRSKNDRKETMKLYMRNYRKRQKRQMELMPEAEKEKILQKQRERVRMRVRRHRLRKKLRASGMPADEIERRLQEVVPTVASRGGARSKRTSTTARGIPVSEVTGLPLSEMDRHMNAICLDLPKNQHLSAHDLQSMRQQLPSGGLNMLGGGGNGLQVDPAVMEHFRRGLPTLQSSVSKIDFDSATHNFPGQDDGAYEEISTPGQVKLSPRRWSVSQVGIFLEGLELGHLKAPFERHGVDGRVLLDMTAQSLIEMNIVPTNSRAELLSAIASLKKVACVN